MRERERGGEREREREREREGGEREKERKKETGGGEKNKTTTTNLSKFISFSPFSVLPTNHNRPQAGTKLQSGRQPLAACSEQNDSVSSA